MGGVGLAHPFVALCFGVIVIVVVLAPIIVGFAWVLPDANRRGQPGIVWALLTIPFSWLAVLVYVIVRAVTPASVP